jgi:hypothetical protein
MEIVMPRCRSSGALSIWSNGVNLRGSGVLVVQHLGDRRGERGLAVVDVTDRADVDVRLGPLETRNRLITNQLLYRLSYASAGRRGRTLVGGTIGCQVKSPAPSATACARVRAL